MTDNNMRKYHDNKYLDFCKSANRAWIKRCGTTPEKEKREILRLFLEREPDRGLNKATLSRRSKVAGRNGRTAERSPVCKSLSASAVIG
jgi:hypothetical protein